MDPRANFTRVIENFECGNCGTPVVGDGYTNHCPNCLFSCHKDNVPGDRANDCGGLMEPVEIRQKSGDMIILHQCQLCGERKPNRVSPNDNFESIARIIALNATLARARKSAK